MIDPDWPRTAHVARPIVITYRRIGSKINIIVASVRSGHIEVGGYGDFFAHIGGYRDFIASVAVAGGGGPEEVGDNDGTAEPRGGGGTAVAASGGLGPGGLSRVGDSRGDGCWQS